MKVESSDLTEESIFRRRCSLGLQLLITPAAHGESSDLISKNRFDKTRPNRHLYSSLFVSVR